MTNLLDSFKITGMRAAGGVKEGASIHAIELMCRVVLSMTKKSLNLPCDIVMLFFQCKVTRVVVVNFS